jgi:hypothetical protein
MVASTQIGTEPQPPDRVVDEAAGFADFFTQTSHEELAKVTDGKAVGTYIERRFKDWLRERGVIGEVEGNAATGIDLPTYGVDIKTTSEVQPQSSSPFRSYKQKVEGLGHHVLVFVYRKQGAQIEFPAIRFVPEEFTADYQTTRGLRRLILDEQANADDVFAFLADRLIPADETQLFEYANLLLKHPPAEGYLTISNALQWRLQFSRVVAGKDLPPGIRSVG